MEETRGHFTIRTVTVEQEMCLKTVPRVRLELTTSAWLIASKY